MALCVALDAVGRCCECCRRHAWVAGARTHDSGPCHGMSFRSRQTSGGVGGERLLRVVVMVLATRFDSLLPRTGSRTGRGSPFGDRARAPAGPCPFEQGPGGGRRVKAGGRPCEYRRDTRSNHHQGRVRGTTQPVPDRQKRKKKKKAKKKTSRPMRVHALIQGTASAGPNISHERRCRPPSPPGPPLRRGCGGPPIGHHRERGRQLSPPMGQLGEGRRAPPSRLARWVIPSRKVAGEGAASMVASGPEPRRAAVENPRCEARKNTRAPSSPQHRVAEVMVMKRQWRPAAKMGLRQSGWCRITRVATRPRSLWATKTFLAGEIVSPVFGKSKSPITTKRPAAPPWPPSGGGVAAALPRRLARASQQRTPYGVQPPPVRRPNTCHGTVT